MLVPLLDFYLFGCHTVSGIRVRRILSIQTTFVLETLSNTLSVRRVFEPADINNSVRVIAEHFEIQYIYQRKPAVRCCTKYISCSASRIYRVPFRAVGGPTLTPQELWSHEFGHKLLYSSTWNYAVLDNFFSSEWVKVAELNIFAGLCFCSNKYQSMLCPDFVVLYRRCSA